MYSQKQVGSLGRLSNPVIELLFFFPSLTGLGEGEGEHHGPEEERAAEPVRREEYGNLMGIGSINLQSEDIERCFWHRDVQIWGWANTGARFPAALILQVYNS